jgi:hypothetical protein
VVGTVGLDQHERPVVGVSTHAAVADSAMTVPIHTMLAGRGCSRASI